MAEIKSIKDLIPDDANPNGGTERGGFVLETSIRRLGAGRSILSDKNGKVIAGNKTLEKAIELGLEVEIVHTDGKKLVVVVRDDLDLDQDSKARELSIADNRASEVSLDWRSKMIEDAKLRYADLRTDYLFTISELANLGSNIKSAVDNARGGGGGNDAERLARCPKCGTEFKP